MPTDNSLQNIIHLLARQAASAYRKESVSSAVDDENQFSIDGIMSYFPVNKLDLAAGTCDQYLIDLRKTVTDNYNNGNYQVAYFYAHLIFMSYVYYCVERTYQIQPDRMKDVFYPINAYNGRNDKPDLEHYNSVYDFSKIPEKEIFKVFYVLGMDHDEINSLSKYISNRDEYAHATGQGNITEDALIHNIRTIKGNMETINKLFYPLLKDNYIKFLLDHREESYQEVMGSAYDYIDEQNISMHELSFLCNLGISGIRNENEGFKRYYYMVKKAHYAFIELCVREYGIKPPDAFPDPKSKDYLYYKYKDSAVEYLQNERNIDPYHAEESDEFFPLYECPNCRQNQLVYDPKSDSFHCFGCGTNLSSSEATRCSLCGALIFPKTESDLCEDCREGFVS